MSKIAPTLEPVLCLAGMEGDALEEVAPARSGSVRLRDAASTIFTLVTLVPLLALLFLLHRHEVLTEFDAQIGLLLALVLSILGFVVLQRLFQQVTRLADAVGENSGESGAAIGVAFGKVGGVGQITEFGQIGTAFARMLDDLKSATVRLEDLVFKLGALNEVAELAARISNIDDLLSLVLERSMRTVRATAGSIMLLEDERRKLRVATARGLPDSALPDDEIDLGDGVSGAAAERGDAVLLPDIRGDTRFGAGASGAFACVPLRVDGRIIGVINLVRRDGPRAPTPFGPTDLQFLTTLMAHVGYSLDNARLLSETRETAARLGTAVRDLQTAQQSLVEGETMRAMGHMASEMAHHLNNLLAVSSGRIQLLLLRASDPDLRRQLEVARQAMDDAADVVRRVLEFSVMHPSAADSRVDLNAVVREVIELSRPRWHDEAQLRGRTVEVVDELSAIPTVSGHASALREVVMNLILNAVDALATGGTVTVRTWEAEGEVYCAIGDDGDGMTEAVRRRAFDPFFTTKLQGVGLGLSVSRAIVQRHRGDLSLDSVPGQGTVATFHIPVAIGPRDHATERAIEPRRILLVDDQPEVRAMLAEALIAQGHAVVQAASGRQALDYLAAGEHADLVLSDLGMPGMTGWDVAEAINRRWRDLPVGLITGWGARSEGTLEQRRSVAFVLAKPFTVETLLTAIARTPPRSRF